MVEEYSDDEFNETLHKINKWGIAFSESKYFENLTDEQKQESEFVLMSFADYMYSYHGLLPEEWNETELEECCLDTLPRKITADESYYRSIAPVLSAFFNFLGKEGLLKNAPKLAKRVTKINKKIVSNASDPRRWGMAKSMLMAAIKAGVDIENQNELNKFMYSYSLQQLKNLKHSDDEIVSIPESMHKIGRNEPCPCGSGKKYKKCCGRS
jgi:hypothetical protein